MIPEQSYDDTLDQHTGLAAHAALKRRSQVHRADYILHLQHEAHASGERFDMEAAKAEA